MTAHRRAPRAAAVRSAVLHTLASYRIPVTLGLGIGLALCLIGLWPPWALPLGGDAYMASRHFLMVASYPAYVVTQPVVTALSDHWGSVLTSIALACLQVVVNLVVLLVVATALARWIGRMRTRSRA
jgi:hypothetical protein